MATKMREQQPIVVAKNLRYLRGNKPIFKDVTLSIQRGLVTAIMGPSGTGKTTLLRLLGGQIHPAGGELTIDQIDTRTLSLRGWQKLRRRMGMLFQEGALFTDLNVYENVAFLLREHTRLPEDMLRDLVLMKLEAVGLRGAANLGIHELSGGMARRVALARAIMMDPALMMYDEPFTGQDPINRGVLLKLIRELNNSLGLTSVVVSHDVEEVAKVADYLYVIADGRVIGEGTPEQVFQDKSPLLHQFMHGLPDGPVAFRYPASDFAEEVGL